MLGLRRATELVGRRGGRGLLRPRTTIGAAHLIGLGPHRAAEPCGAALPAFGGGVAGRWHSGIPEPKIASIGEAENDVSGVVAELVGEKQQTTSAASTEEGPSTTAEAAPEFASVEVDSTLFGEAKESLAEIALRGRISRAAERNDFQNALKCWKDARARDPPVELDAQSLVKILSTFAAHSPPAARSQGAKNGEKVDYAAKACEVFDALLEIEETPNEMAFNLIMKACAQSKNSIYAQKVLALNPSPSVNFRTNFVIACALSGEVLAAEREYFKMKGQELTGSAQMYTSMANAELGKNRSKLSTAIIRDMIAAGYQPNIRLLMRVMENAIDQTDSDSLRLLLMWIQSLNGVLDRGSCQALLGVAARKGDTQLATRAWNVLETNGYPATEEAYAAVVHAFGVDRDDLSMFGALLEMESRGLTPSSGLINTVAGHLTLTLRRTDSAFFMLRDMHERGESKITASAMNAVILACAKLQQLDRSFATFEEMSSLFGLQYDLNSFNALLSACAQDRNPQPEAALAIMDNMKGSGITPDDASHKYLMLTLARSGRAQELDDMLERLAYDNWTPPADIFVDLAHHYLRVGELDRASTMSAKLENHGYRIPSYLRYRLENCKP